MTKPARETPCGHSILGTRGSQVKSCHSDQHLLISRPFTDKFTDRMRLAACQL